MTDIYNKKELRKITKNRRDAIEKHDIALKSANIAKKLINTQQYRESNTIFCYISFGSEVETDMIINGALESGKTIAVPIIINKQMFAAKMDASTRLAQNSYGIYEPVEPDIITKDNIDLTIVPGLLFNTAGYRLGYGGGYYDRFLTDYKGLSIGVAFKEFISNEIVPDSFDMPVNFIITD